MPLSRCTIETDRDRPARLSRLAGLPRLAGRVLLGLALLVLFGPASATAQDGSVQSLIEQGRTAGADIELMQSVAARAGTAGLGPKQTAELLRPAVTVAEKGLPAGPLLNKTLEGLAKRVPPSRMTPVLQTLQANTERAGSAVTAWLNRDDVKQLVGESNEGSARADLIANATEAQQQDVSLETIEQFLDGLPGAVERRSVSVAEVATAVSVMPDLPGSADNPTVTRQLLTAALDAGYDGEALRQLPAALERARRQTQRPAGMVARGAAQAVAQGTPATRVLRSLFQGSVPGGGPPGDAGNGPPGTLPGQGKAPGEGGKVPPGVDPGNPGDNPGGGPGDNPGGGPGDNPGGGPGDNPGDNPGGGG
jgi:hypothetical protein